MRHIVALSGGKDSTALAIHLKDTRPELTVEYCFADTGRELPGVYAFLDELEGYLDQKIVRLDDWGRKFDYYLEKWNYFLPGYQSRWCTKHLKIRPFERYARGFKKKWQKKHLFEKPEPSTVYIGIRADEDRVGNYGDIAGIDYAYPFIEDGIDLEGVMKILKEAEIDLPDFYKWRSTGGCYMCPWQRPKDWLGLKKHHPDLFQKALEEEKKATESSGKPCSWSVRRKPLPELLERMRDKPELYDENTWEKDDVFADDYPCLICAK